MTARSYCAILRTYFVLVSYNANNSRKIYSILSATYSRLIIALTSYLFGANEAHRGTGGNTNIISFKATQFLWLLLSMLSMCSLVFIHHTAGYYVWHMYICYDTYPRYRFYYWTVSDFTYSLNIFSENYCRYMQVDSCWGKKICASGNTQSTE